MTLFEKLMLNCHPADSGRGNATSAPLSLSHVAQGRMQPLAIQHEDYVNLATVHPTGIQFVMYKFGKLFTLFPLADSSQQLYKLYHVRVVLTSQLESSRTKENIYLLEVLASRRTGGKWVEICRKLVESNDLRCHALTCSHALHNSMTSLWNEGSVASNISTIFSSKASAKHSKTRTSSSQITAIDEWHHKCYSENRLCLWQEWAEKERSPPCRRSSL